MEIKIERIHCDLGKFNKYFPKNAVLNFSKENNIEEKKIHFGGVACPKEMDIDLSEEAIQSLDLSHPIRKSFEEAMKTKKEVLLICSVFY